MKFSLWPESIKTRVTLSALGVFLLSLWVLSSLTSWLLEKDIAQLVAANQLSVATQMAAQVDRELNRRLTALERNAGLIGSELMEDRTALQNLLRQCPLLDTLFNVNISVLNRDGMSVADNPLNSERVGDNDRPCVDAFAVALEEGRSNVGCPVVVGPATQPLISMATPIRDGAGQIIGALGGSIDLGRPNFFDAVTDEGYGVTGLYSVVSRGLRTIVTSSDPRRIMLELPPAGTNLMLDRALSGEEGTDIYVNEQGVKMLTTVKSLSASDWFVAVMTPTAEAFAPIEDMKRRMTLITLVVTLLVGIIIWWLLQRQLRPMLTTVDALGQMVESDRPLKSLPLTGGKEVDNLIGAFNRLLHALGEREEENRRFRTIADNAVYGKSVVDLQGNFVYVNRFFAEIHGYAPAELIGKNLTIFHSPEQLDQVVKENHLLRRDGYYCPREIWHVHRDGRKFPMLMSGVLLKDDQGNPQYLAATAVDITDRKTAELALQQKNDELEQFVYIVSHDLKSPLITINTFLGMLQEDISANNTEGITEDLQFIKEATGKMESLLNALLRLSRIGRIDSSPQTQSLKKLVDDCLKILAGTLKQHQVNVVIGELQHQWHGDPLHFGQIWQNLIENAVKYMGDQPDPRIEIGAEDRAEGLVFYVCDNGIGLAPEHHQRIFNVFAQLDRNSEGTGLGLALVKKIVTIYQGEIWAESAGEGQGSCFCFTLPGAISHEAETAMASCPGKKANATSQ